MYKLIRVKIGRSVNGTMVGYSYPKEYDAQKIQVLTYESMIDGKLADIHARGNLDEYLFGFVKEEDLNSFLQSPDITEVTKDEAINFIGAFVDNSIVKVVKEQPVLEVLMKNARGEALTVRDREIINPDSNSKEVIRTKTLRQRMTDYGV